MKQQSIVKAIYILSVIVIVSGCTSIMPLFAPTVDHEANISEEFNYVPHFVDVLGSRMHYVDEGTGEIVLLVHGNPTSSYLWRNIIPTLAQTHRVIALDLIGMGKSSKPDIDYTLQDHIRYFTAFVEELKLNNISLVLHDWGGAIGLSYARNYPHNVKQIALMETVTKPLYWEDADFLTRYLFKRFRDQKDGDQLLINDNYFLEELLPMMAGRSLTKKELDCYKEPFLEKRARKPVRVWPQEVPLDGVPKRNYDVINANYNFLKTSSVPVLFIYSDPGVTFSKKTIKVFKKDIPRAEFSFIGEGMHYIQESQPRKVSKAISVFINDNKK